MTHALSVRSGITLMFLGCLLFSTVRYMHLVSRVTMENWPVLQRVYALTAFIENKLLVEVQRRFRREFGLQHTKVYCFVTLFVIGYTDSETLAVFAIASSAVHISLHSRSY
jgi:hypothetical protein